MVTSTSETLSRENAALIDRLIVACNDDARAQTSAALVVGGARGAALNGKADRRGRFAHELGDLVRNFGDPPERGSAYETFRAAAHGVRAILVGENVGDAYSACARIEAKTEKLYERAMRADVPRAVSSVMNRQYAEITADREELRRLSMGG